MKKSIFYLLSCLLLASCASDYKEIGSLKLLADHRIDSTKKYSQITTASGSKLREIRHTKAECMKDAMDEILKRVPGGEFLTNVRVYAVHGGFIAVSGDVWGEKDTLLQQGATTTASSKKTQ